MENLIDSPFSTIVCFSHLRWDFVYQRPQHLLSRFSKHFKVYFIEEPIFENIEADYFASKRSDRVTVIVPHLRRTLLPLAANAALTYLLDQFLLDIDLKECLFWYYTPMALLFSDHHQPKMILYDCMDELSAFKFAPPELISLEKKLLATADLVFTGGNSLYEAKKNQHANIYLFPSSIDKEHFLKARNKNNEAAEQSNITGPKIGFFGVIDERFDLLLIQAIADERPEWQIILIGPVIKIDFHSLPQRSNIHYLGTKSYDELPEYIAGWDVAMIPFQLNDSTRFISPTKTPEYLAAGVPVVSSAINDVVKPYGVQKLVHICSTTDSFINAIESELHQGCKRCWLKSVDLFLSRSSWDDTCELMIDRFNSTLKSRTIALTGKKSTYA